MSDAADVTDTIEDDRSEVELAIADQIAQLSLAEDTPTEFEPTGRALDASEVDFTSGAWMTRLAEVQWWLRLPEPLPQDGVAAFVGALARGLGHGAAESTVVETHDGELRLTAIGLDRLLSRLQRAVQLQEGFTSALEADGATRASATGTWRESWEDDAGDDDESGEPVSAKALTWAINEFSYRASRNRLDLSPSYQRGDVWPTSDAQMLIESILRGIPLPSVILLKRDDDEAPYEVVDGKQRLTAILRFIGKHPLARQNLADADVKHPDAGLPKLFDEDYPAFRRAWKNHTGEPLTDTRERELHFPFKLRKDSKAMSGNLRGLRGKYYTQIREERVRVGDAVEVRELFEQTTEYKIPLIEYSKASTRQIHEVFNLYNKQGKHLNAEEIRNAVFHDVDLMRGLLVAAGDNKKVESVAPFLKPAWNEVSEVPGMLDAYGIGSARYRRTKVLSWLAAMLLVDSTDPTGQPKRLSTARHIDALLDRIQRDTDDPLSKEATVLDAILLLHRGLYAHSAIDDAWAHPFRDTKTGSKWQELQLIASVLGVTIAAASLGDAVADQLEAAAPSLREKTGTKAWQRPHKTQTASQWEYIARISLMVVHEIGADLDESSAELVARFGHSCVPALQAIAADSRSA